ncbi:DUF5819 family protein [Streptomyces beihaiensis]|uniref:DUF5819 family protein n=1 Tax=Streptomyces beihaiensis TaxID=2984495 RepID=A0ABT3TXL8_9ACTN|nr:DUF5819 family protein [Streptomyces beihaiensis]MCX3061802.1 DUF5819 family protein [Streptomyces beihaiensis]
METETGAAGEAARPSADRAPSAPADEQTQPAADTALDDTAARPSGRLGIAGLSPGYQLTAALALAAVAVVACVHVLMVFLYVAPPNTLTKRHGDLVDEWIYPEFEQNWKLFAPNPLQQNIAVQARAELRAPDGSLRTTGWYDLSAQDGAAIHHNPVPSHTQQNELRRAWDIFVSTHDAKNRSTGLRGDLSEQYLRRIIVLRLDRLDVGAKGDVVERVQVRSRATTIAPPKWSDEKVSQKPVYRQAPWWPVTKHDAPLDSGSSVRAGADDSPSAKGGVR